MFSEKSRTVCKVRGLLSDTSVNTDTPDFTVYSLPDQFIPAPFYDSL